jgi:hypothetical protein
MDVRELCDASASRLAPNAERLVAAFRGGKLDRCPNFEILSGATASAWSAT